MQINRIAMAAASALLLASAPLAAQTGPDSDLLTAIARDDPAAAQAALAAGANARASSRDGSVLAIAAMFGRPEIVRMLLERGADPALPGPDGGNALSAAFFAMNGSTLLGRDDHPTAEQRAKAVAVVRLIAARHVGLDILVRRGPTAMTPLMMAAQVGAADVVRVLLDAGANPNTPNGGGYTALDYAADRAPIWINLPTADRVDVVRALLAKGARPDHVGRDGQSPLTRARRAGNADVLAALQANAH